MFESGVAAQTLPWCASHLPRRRRQHAGGQLPRGAHHPDSHVQEGGELDAPELGLADCGSGCESPQIAMFKKAVSDCLEGVEHFAIACSIASRAAFGSGSRGRQAFTALPCFANNLCTALPCFANDSGLLGTY